MDIRENAAYLKGLAEGYEINAETKEGKIISQLIELAGKMANAIAELEAECADMREYIEELDHDLGAVEEDLYFGDEEECFDDDFEEEFDNDFDDSEYDELICPSCGELICVDESLELSEVICPACGEKLGDIELCDGDCDSCGESCEQ